MTKWTYTLRMMALTLMAVITITCKNNKPSYDLSSIDLLRGELVLCSGDQFGDVSFSLSCNYDTRETFDLAFHYCTLLNMKRLKKPLFR